MENKQLTTEARVMLAAEAIKKYCGQHECNDECIYYCKLRFCILDTRYPETWRIESLKGSGK